MYAVIEDSGTQIRVQEGDELRVANRSLGDDQATILFDKVLLLKPDDAAAKVGQPYVDGAKVTADILSEEPGEKVLIVKFKRRKNYIRRNGHRQPYIRVKVTGIEG